MRRPIGLMGLMLALAIMLTAVSATGAFAMKSLVLSTEKGGPITSPTNIDWGVESFSIVGPTVGTHCGPTEPPWEDIIIPIKKGKIIRWEGTITQALTGRCTSGTEVVGNASEAQPWSYQLKSDGTARMKGNKKLAFEATFPEIGGAKCVFEASKLSLSYTIPGPVDPVATEQKLKYNKKLSAKTCPHTALLNAEFELSAEGEPLLAEVN